MPASPILTLPRTLADRRARRVGLLGGSFNPAHRGHRTISLLALKLLALDEVWWLVSPQNPLKPLRGMASLAERMATAAREARHPRIKITDLEARIGRRYTADTLAELGHRFPRTRFVWLMGADNLRQIPRWRRWTRIFDLAAIAVFARPAYSLGALGGLAAQRYSRFRLDPHAGRGLARMTPPAWAFFPTRLDPLSATSIRDRRRRGVFTRQAASRHGPGAL
jgi:nicotinate-nucleotide adenylyltransferase